MKLEKAYSYELKKDITPVEADIQFQRGTICSKFNFRCPDKTCKAQVTCANLDRPKRLRKRNPYYKVVGEHSNDCLIAKNIEKQPDRRKNYDIYGQEDEPIENAFRINLQPPITKKNESSDIDSSTRKTPSNSELNGNQTSHSKRQPQPEKTLSSLVDSFLNNETISIQLPTIGSISIQKLFLEINKQDIATLPDEWRIYHGQAWINKKDNGYSIVFKNELTSGKIKKKPSFYITNTDLNNSGFMKFNQQKMMEISNKTPKQVFLLSETAPYLKDGKFINICCEAPHYMDYRL